MKKLSERDRLAIAKRLAVSDRSVVIGVREAAVIYNTTVAAIQQACSSMRVARGDVTLRLPPRVQGLGRRVGWLLGDVRDLLERSRDQLAAAATGPIGISAGTPDDARTNVVTGSVVLDRPKRMGRKRKS